MKKALINVTKQKQQQALLFISPHHATASLYTNPSIALRTTSKHKSEPSMLEREKGLPTLTMRAEHVTNAIAKTLLQLASL
jgi:hypothetical protein